MSNPIHAVVDTNVVLSALRSQNGASFRLLRLVGDPRWRMHISVSLLLQYEAVVRREAVPLYASADEATKFIDYLCSASQHQAIYFAWRPQLSDPNDEFILELAVAAGASQTFAERKNSVSRQLNLASFCVSLENLYERA